ncbi:MAG: triple tyrosine motif-containing protein [Dysgonomonas sp.]|nr:triple tyrosine motif-containing protein [Dysgonomonas sp.]
MEHFFKYAVLTAILLFAVPLYSNKPHIINLNRDKYQADNKNWSIGQDKRGFMYFGNDIGLLEFDGIKWNLNRLPNSLTVRSVAVLSHETIFTGSYEEFGRWDRDVSGKLVYTSISDLLDKALFKNDDFWKIWIGEGCVYFQSFSSIYVYDYESVKRVPAEHGFLFLTKVRDEFIVQQMLGPLFKLKGKELVKIENSDIFKGTDARVILPYGDDKYLIGTSTAGIYIYDGKTFEEWNNGLSKELNSKELNCGVLTSEGTYLLGTILDGIYEVDLQGRILDKISTQSNLQNNTVLALYEDNVNNIWVALDKGIAYIQYNGNLSYYTDLTGNTGAVYCAARWNGKLFIGTNQGVFYIPESELSYPNALSRMIFLAGTQGQVWDLRVIDNKLYCCHNKGLKEILPNLSITEPFSIGTGIYNITEANITDRNLLVLSTYQSIKIIDKETGEIFSPGQISEPINKAEVDHLGNVWLEHFNRGIYRCKLDENMSGFRNFSYYGGNNKDGLSYKMKLFKVGGRVVLLGNSRFYTYDDIANQIVPNAILDECFKSIISIKQIISINKNTFWALTPTSIYKFFYDGYEASILEAYGLGLNLSLVNTYENISVLDDSSSLVCLDNGFILYNKIGEGNNVLNRTLYSPLLESMGTFSTDGSVEYKNLSEEAKVSYNYNSITFWFSVSNAFSQNLSFQYMLEGVDPVWSVPQKINSVSYARLPKGKYIFHVRTVDELGTYSEITSYEFQIMAPWYQTPWAYILYIVVILVLFYVIWMLVLRRYRNLHLQKIRQRETRRLRTLNGELQNKVEQKNAELLTQTSFIIHKNELIMKIKDILDDFYAHHKSNTINPLYQKINSLLNNNMNSEDDWKMFLIKFEEKHTGFFKKMKSLYPQLTNNDLRLCACLKLNLETKEIAALMNLSVRAVENSRYRLRKKLNIQPSQNLNEFFLTID